MSWYVYLPIAHQSLSLPLVIGLGFIVGLLSGLFGVGGGFLLTPLLIMFGIPPTVAAASDSNQIVAASASGSYAHYRMGNVDFKMGLYLLVGGIIGGTGGVQIIKILRQMGNADFLIKITYVLMLGFVGGYMLYESIQTMRKSKLSQTVTASAGDSVYSRLVKKLPYQTRFEKSGIVLSPLVPLFLGTLVGVLSAIMGVGGGFIMVPVMVYLLRMPMHVVVGTSLFQVLFTCINVTVMQAYTNRTVDFILALLLLVGSTLGAQIGARLSTRLKDDQIKIYLAVIVLLVMVKMLFGLIIPPHSLLSYHGGH
ncbi:MAG: permease [Desulfobacterales bacterium RIFOXYA12_FULL_46_15]|nr:MAG: permease [Desulfobacula sp. GWF2_41_7]OGR24273.1 MAG: permease [Desulfobacterales bacterium RIFOXYA12_FULL_46_15]